MLDILQDAIIDTIKLVPFLFITYLIMEYIENKKIRKIWAFYRRISTEFYHNVDFQLQLLICILQD